MKDPITMQAEVAMVSGWTYVRIIGSGAAVPFLVGLKEGVTLSQMVPPWHISLEAAWEHLAVEMLAAGWTVILLTTPGIKSFSRVTLQRLQLDNPMDTEEINGREMPSVPLAICQVYIQFRTGDHGSGRSQRFVGKDPLC